MTTSLFKIKQAWIVCLKQTAFEQLSVSELVRTAHVNRGTFYQHYTDKYDLLAHYEDQLCNALAQIFEQHFQTTMIDQTEQVEHLIYPVVRKTLQLVQAEQDLLRSLLGPHGDPRFEYRLKHQIKHALQQRLTVLKGQPELTTQLPADYAWALLINDLFTPVQYWLFHPNPITIDALADIIMKTRYLSPYQQLGLND